MELISLIKILRKNTQALRVETKSINELFLFYCILSKKITLRVSSPSPYEKRIYVRSVYSFRVFVCFFRFTHGFLYVYVVDIVDHLFDVCLFCMFYRTIKQCKVCKSLHIIESCCLVYFCLDFFCKHFH